MEQTRWSAQTKLVVSLLCVALFVYLLFRFSEALPPLVIAIILAYIVAPLAYNLKRRFGFSNGLSTLLAYILFFGGIGSIGALILPLIIPEFTALNVDVQMLLRHVEQWIAYEVRIGEMVFSSVDFFEQIRSALTDLIRPIIGQSLGMLMQIISSLVWVIFVLIISFYLVKDGAALKRWAEQVVPPYLRADYIRLRDEINAIWGAFFRGQLYLALVVALIFLTIGFVIGLPFALALAILAGLLEFLPSIGHGIWLTLAVGLSLIFGSTWLDLPNWAFALLVFGLHIVFQQFDLNYLIPRIIGRQVHLPPLVVILGIVAGALMAGVIGIPLAAPVIASARVLGRYVYANLFDLDPFPAPGSQALPPPNPKWWNPVRSEERAAFKGETQNE